MGLVDIYIILRYTYIAVCNAIDSLIAYLSRYRSWPTVLAAPWWLAPPCPALPPALACPEKSRAVHIHIYIFLPRKNDKETTLPPPRPRRSGDGLEAFLVLRAHPPHSASGLLSSSPSCRSRSSLAQDAVLSRVPGPASPRHPWRKRSRIVHRCFLLGLSLRNPPPPAWPR